MPTIKLINNTNQINWTKTDWSTYVHTKFINLYEKQTELAFQCEILALA